MTKLFARNPNRVRDSKLDVTFNIINIVFLVLGVIIVLFPVLNYLALAFSDGTRNLDVILFPKGITIAPFQYIFTGGYSEQFWRSFLNSVIITVVITVGSNLIEAMAAYPLSKQDCPFRSGLMLFFIITMLFSAGIVPIYMVMNMFGLLDTIWSVILCSLSNVFNLLLFKTFFEGIPTDLEEAAHLDGASEIQMFFRVVIPICLPVFGSCCFFSMVSAWNTYGAALLFISQDAKASLPLSYYIFIVISATENQFHDKWLLINKKNVQAALIMASIIPILCFYPYVARYIKSGLMIGSVKG